MINVLRSQSPVLSTVLPTLFRVGLAKLLVRSERSGVKVVRRRRCSDLRRRPGEAPPKPGLTEDRYGRALPVIKMGV